MKFITAKEMRETTDANVDVEYNKMLYTILDICKGAALKGLSTAYISNIAPRMREQLKGLGYRVVDSGSRAQIFW